MSAMLFRREKKKCLPCYIYLPLLIILSAYSGGALVVLWYGLPFHYISWSTFFIINIEFYSSPEYHQLIVCDWFGFSIPIAIWLLAKAVFYSSLEIP